MSTLYLSNKGSTVKIKIDNINLQYLGPKNLIRFMKINSADEGVLYVDTLFADTDGNGYIEEDYIDIEDLLLEFKYDVQSILKEVRNYTIGDKSMRSIIKQGG